MQIEHIAGVQVFLHIVCGRLESLLFVDNRPLVYVLGLVGIVDGFGNGACLIFKNVAVFVLLVYDFALRVPERLVLLLCYGVAVLVEHELAVFIPEIYVLRIAVLVDIRPVHVVAARIHEIFGREYDVAVLLEEGLTVYVRLYHVGVYDVGILLYGLDCARLVERCLDLIAHKPGVFIAAEAEFYIYRSVVVSEEYGLALQYRLDAGITSIGILQKSLCAVYSDVAAARLIAEALHIGVYRALVAARYGLGIRRRGNLPVYAENFALFIIGIPRFGVVARLLHSYEVVAEIHVEFVLEAVRLFGVVTRRRAHRIAERYGKRDRIVKRGNLTLGHRDRKGDKAEGVLLFEVQLALRRRRGRHVYPVLVIADAAVEGICGQLYRIHVLGIEAARLYSRSLRRLRGCGYHPVAVRMRIGVDGNALLHDVAAYAAYAPA